jgi:1,4-alpha-glucan branching enzyme
MGCEFGQWREWNHDASLDWHLLDHEFHRGIQRCVRDLNRLYAREPALHERDFDPSGFQWIDCSDHENSVVSLLRRAATPPTTWCGAQLHARAAQPVSHRRAVEGTLYRELLNTDSAIYGGSDVGNSGAVMPEQVPAHGFDQSLCLELPPLGCVILKPERAEA